MKLSSITVRNFRAIREANIPLDKYSIIIGKNDVGKSSLLEAIRIFLEFDTPAESDFYMFDDSNNIVIHGEFNNVPDRLLENLSDDYKNNGQFAITLRYEDPGGRHPDKIEINGTELEAGAIVQEGEELTMSNSRSHIKSDLPDTISVLAERDYEDETEFKRNALLTELLSPIFETEELGDEKDAIKTKFEEQCEDLNIKLNEVISDQHPVIDNVQIQVDEVDLSKSISPKIEVHDGNLDEWMGLSDRGSGVGNQFILSMMQAYGDTQLQNTYLVLFEEPENSLHPRAVREMGSAFYDISQRESQVIITTHSQALLNSPDDASIIIARNDAGSASFESVDDEGIEALEEIGAKNSDILQSDYVLYTEGGSDAAVLEVILKREVDPKLSEGITVQPAGGSNIEHALENMQAINRNSGILLDSDKTSPCADYGEQTELIKNEAERVGLDYWILERRAIENYFHPKAIHEVLGNGESLDIEPFLDIEDILKNSHGYTDGKVTNARLIADKMYELNLDSEFEEIKEYIAEIEARV